MAPRSKIGRCWRWCSFGRVRARLRSEPPEGRDPTPTELLPSVEAAFPRESYAPGDAAALVVFNRARGLTLQLFRSGPDRVVTRSNAMMDGVPVSARRAVGLSRGRKAIAVRIGDLAERPLLRATRRAGRAHRLRPVRRPAAPLGEQRVAVVLPTLTWQAYNLRDDDGDGTADTVVRGLADEDRPPRAAVPQPRRALDFRRYDLPFLHWLAWTGREVDMSRSRTSKRRARAGWRPRTT